MLWVLDQGPSGCPTPGTRISAWCRALVTEPAQPMHVADQHAGGGIPASQPVAETPGGLLFCNLAPGDASEVTFAPVF